MKEICAGLNVLELGSGSVATAMAGMVLADSGAHVIKVEPPCGDLLRTHNPSGFLVWNRGKDSVSLDLRTAAGRDRVQELTRSADVVIDGCGPGKADGWDVGPTALCALNPALIHCSVTGFGRTGSYRDVPARDSLVAAKAGLWVRGAFGHRDGPIMYPVPWGSFGAAMQTVAGVMGALLVREQTGLGQQLDATLFAGLEPIDYFGSVVVQLSAKRGQEPSADMRSLTAVSRYGVLLPTRDNWYIQTATVLPHQGRALCQVLGVLSAVEADPRFARMPMFDTPEIAQEWEDLVMEASLSQDLAHWLPLLTANADVAFEVASTSEQGLDHPQILHNGDVITVNDPVVGPIRQVGPVGHFSETPIGPRRSAPRLGQSDGGFTPKSSVTAQGTPPKHPYSGTTIVEFGSFYAMPYATAMLADLGARVIKIEDGVGDPHRASFGPEVGSAKTTAGKESLSVDLGTDAGRRLVQQLVAQADVFVTGFRSGVAERRGLGEADLRALNPRLLYVQAAGYGTDGPYAHRALYAQAAQSVGGSFGRQVGYWLDPDRGADMSLAALQAVVLPRLRQVIDGDSNAALALLAALSLGIYHQRRTDSGQRLDTSMIAGNALAYSDDFCCYPGKPPAAVCDDDYWGTGALDRCYPAAGGSYVCVSVPTDEEFRVLVGTLGLPELAADPRFASGDARASHDAELIEALRQRFADKRGDEWEALLLAAGVGCVEVPLSGQPVVTSFDQALRDAGLTTTYEHPLFGQLVRVAPAVAFSATPGRVGAPCVRGEHNHALLAELGCTDEEISTLEGAGVVIAPGPQSGVAPVST